MHESIFSYNLSRPYPYRWFTWVVFGGGIIAAALFTVLNVAADGYNLSNVYSSNPNRTTENVFWFQKQPWSWAAKVATTCQPQTISVGSSFQTDKTGFTYTVQNITQRGPNGSCSQQPSFAYQNVGLSCNVTRMTLTAMNQTTSDWEISQAYQVGLITLVYTVTAYGSCSLIDDSWGTQFDLSASTGFDSGMGALGYQIVSQGPNYHLGLLQVQPYSSGFWGQVLTYFYTSILVKLADTRPDSGFLFSNTNANADYFFDFTSGFLASHMLFLDGANANQTKLYGGDFSEGMPIAYWFNNTYIADLSGVSTNSTRGQWMDAINGYVKVVYCTVLSDLGQPGLYNMLSSPELGQALFTQARDISIWTYSSDVPHPRGNEAWKDFAWELKNIFGEYYVNVLDIKDPPLSNSTEFFAWLGQIINGTNIGAPTKPSVSTISAQYLCQVPERKGWGSLLVSVLVADIVFLQVLWKLLCWIATFMVERGDEQTKYCIGCAKKFQIEDYVMLTPTADAVAMPPAAAATSAKRLCWGRQRVWRPRMMSRNMFGSALYLANRCQRLRHRSRDVL